MSACFEFGLSTTTSTTLLVVLIVSACVVATALPIHKPVPAPAPAPAPAQEKYAVVAMQWPMGLCKTSGCDQGVMIPSDKFTLHGVWPTAAGGSSIVNCVERDKFSSTYIKTTQASTLWRSYKGLNIDFWKHEWKRHGTCAELGFREYIDRSLKLAKSHGELLYKTFDKAGIRPSPQTNMQGSNVPLVEKYFNTILTALKLVVEIKCKSTGDGNVYLLEIHLCASFDLKTVQNCSAAAYHDCGRIKISQRKALYYIDPKNV